MRLLALTALPRYISATFLLVPFGVLTARIYDEERHARSQSYYYALIAGIIYAIISTFLLLNVIGASNLSVSVSGKAEFQVLRQRYSPSFKILSIAQRGIMLQTISFVLYLALMAGVYSAIEGWSFVDAVYWADYTLLTIGLGMLARSNGSAVTDARSGSDFTPETTLGRFLLIPFSLFGFIFLGLVVNSVRSLLIERAREKRRARNLIARREKWQRKFDHNVETVYEERQKGVSGRCKTEDTERLDQELWLKKEFQLMRHIEAASEMLEKYSSAGVALVGFLLVWIGGSLVFWRCERVRRSNDSQSLFLF
jgi:potassium channel subfamily K, other eukaryote